MGPETAQTKSRTQTPLINTARPRPSPKAYVRFRPKCVAAHDFMNGPVVVRDIDIVETNAVKHPMELRLHLDVVVQVRNT